MSTQLMKGSNPVGSAGYFFELAGESGILQYTRDADIHRYHDILQDLALHAEQTLEIIERDLKQYKNTLRFFPEHDRRHMAELVKGLGELAEYGGRSGSSVSSILALLELSSFDTRGFSSASVSEVEEWSEPVIRGTYFSPGRQMEFLARTIESDVVRIAEEQEERFLRDVCSGKGRDQLIDMLYCSKYRLEHTSYTGECGYEVCTEPYRMWAEQRVFERNMSGILSAYDYKGYIKNRLKEIASTIREDLKDGEWNNDFLKDAEAERLREAVRHLEMCEVSCYDLSDLISKLDWYVGGDESKILELQRTLNKIGVGSINEDGVWGPNTHKAWIRFLNILAKGSVPSLTWVDPLQSNVTGIVERTISTKISKELSTLRDISHRAVKLNKDGSRKGVSVFRVDKGDEGFHLNTVSGMELKNNIYNMTKMQNYFREKINHTVISEKTFNVLKDFDNIKTPIKIGGRIIAVTGLALDAYRLGTTIYSDLNDADAKLGKDTVMTSSSIVASWAAGAAFAEAGAWLGAQIGTAIFPGIGTLAVGFLLGLTFGCIGAAGGEELAEWVVELHF